MVIVGVYLLPGTFGHGELAFGVSHLDMCGYEVADYALVVADCRSSGLPYYCIGAMAILIL